MRQILNSSKFWTVVLVIILTFMFLFNLSLASSHTFRVNKVTKINKVV